MDVVAGPTSTFPAVAKMDDAAGYLHAVLMMQADSPLRRREREDTHEVGPRRAINSARFAPYSDMTRPVSLLLPGLAWAWNGWIVLAREAESALPETVLGSQSYLALDPTKVSR
jgi:hypothetical protein